MKTYNIRLDNRELFVGEEIEIKAKSFKEAFRKAKEWVKNLEGSYDLILVEIKSRSKA